MADNNLVSYSYFRYKPPYISNTTRIEGFEEEVVISNTSNLDHYYDYIDHY